MGGNAASGVVEANIIKSEVVPLPDLAYNLCPGGTMKLPSPTPPFHSGIPTAGSLGTRTGNTATATGGSAASTGLSPTKRLERDVVSAVAHATPTSSAILGMVTYRKYPNDTHIE